jgi:hypothetical protein
MSARQPDLFDIGRPEQELEAHKRNWRPWILFAGLALAMAAVIAIEPHLWWTRTERPERRPDVEPAFDMAALTDFHHPEPPVNDPIIQEVPVEKRVEVPVEIEKPKLVKVPPPPQPRGDTTIKKVRLSGAISFEPGGDPKPSYMHDGTRPLEAWGCALRPGLSLIHATFNDDIRWDYGGPISATVTEDVLSPEAFARGSRRVLIPAGAQLVGVASSATLDRGMDLATGPLWTEVDFVDTTGMPRSINLFDAQGANAAGVNGIGGEVDPRWLPILGAAVLFTALDTLGSINVNLGSSTDNAVNVRVGGRSSAEIGREVVGSMLQWQPRIFTPKGTQIIVKPIRAVRIC